MPAIESKAERIERITYFWDRFRGISAGINDAVFSTFLLLIAIRVFDASSTQKSIIISALWVGMFLMPVCLWLVSYYRLRCNIACTIYTFITALCFTASIFAGSVEFFVATVSLSMIVGVQGFTLLPRILAENYRPEIRGKRVGTTVMIASIVFMVCSQLFGYILDRDLRNYVWILATSATAYYAVSFFYFKIPSPRLKRPKSRFPYHTIQLFWKDANFAKLAIYWSLIEFGNYMMIPIRMEYLANEHYGINFSNTQITWMLAIVPLGLSLLTSQTWGRLIDSLRVETVQALMGGLVVFSILLFFISNSFVVMLLSMAVFGLTHSAQKVLNHLWLTKVVHKSQVSDYTSAFSILNGLRGILAPVAVYSLLRFMSPGQVGLIAALIIGLGATLLILLRRSTLGRFPV